MACANNKSCMKLYCKLCRPTHTYMYAYEKELVLQDSEGVIVVSPAWVHHIPQADVKTASPYPTPPNTCILHMSIQSLILHTQLPSPLLSSRLLVVS